MPKTPEETKVREKVLSKRKVSQFVPTEESPVQPTSLRKRDIAYNLFSSAAQAVSSIMTTPKAKAKAQRGKRKELL